MIRINNGGGNEVENEGAKTKTCHYDTTNKSLVIREIPPTVVDRNYILSSMWHNMILTAIPLHIPKPLPYRAKNSQKFFIKLDTAIITIPIEQPIAIYSRPLIRFDRILPKGKIIVITTTSRGRRKNTEILSIEGSNCAK